MENFFNNVNISYKDISSGVIAHNSNGDVIIGYPLKTLEEIKKSKIENSKLIYRNGNMGINIFQKFNTQKSIFSSSIRNTLYGAFDYGIEEIMANIEEFYAYNLTSIPTSDFFSACVNLKKIYLPACTNVATHCFLFSGVKRDLYLFGSYSQLLTGLCKPEKPSTPITSYFNKIYVPQEYYSNWCNVSPLIPILEVYNGL